MTEEKPPLFCPHCKKPVMVIIREDPETGICYVKKVVRIDSRRAQR